VNWLTIFRLIDVPKEPKFPKMTEKGKMCGISLFWKFKIYTVELTISQVKREKWKKWKKNVKNGYSSPFCAKSDFPRNR